LLLNVIGKKIIVSRCHPELISGSSTNDVDAEINRRYCPQHVFSM